MPPGRLAVAVACVASAMLLVEIIVTRLFSVLFYYHFSFFAVSLVMSGLVIGGILAARTDPREGSEEVFERSLSVLSSQFSALIIVALVAITTFTQPDIGGAPSLVMVALYGLIFLPGLIAAGSFLAMAFARNKEWIGTLYAWDLVAAAVACLSAIALLRLLQGPVVLLAPALIAAVGALILARGRREQIAGVALVALSVAMIAVSAAGGHTLFRITPEGLRKPILERWNEHSRIIAFKDDSATRELIIDRAAATYMRSMPLKPDGSLPEPDPAWRKGAQFPVYAVERQLDNVAIIGVGGGQDLLPPVWHGAKRIDGYELNKTFIDLIQTDFKDFNSLGARPEVHLIHSEARVGIAHSGRQYDVIQASMIDTWAATASGGFVLSENGLYTREGWQVFLSHLTDNGILTMTRWHIADAPAETHRLLALAAVSYTHLDPPSVIAAPRDDVDLFVLVLSDIAGPKLPRLAIERISPGVSKPVGVDLVQTGHADERVVGRDRVRLRAVHVKSQNLAEQLVDVLSVVVRIIRRSAVAGRGIEKTVRPELEEPAIVVLG